MPRTRKQRCSNHSNLPDEKPQRRRIKKDQDSDDEDFIKEVEQGKRFLAGILPQDQQIPIRPPIPNDLPPDPNNLPQNNMDKLQAQFLPHDNPLRLPEEPAPGENPGTGNELVDAFIAQHRAYRYAQERDQLRRDWEAIENRITAAYLECQTKTLNWTRKSCYLNTRTDACRCTRRQFYYRKVDLIGVLSR
jgi:hypothetical protein